MSIREHRSGRGGFTALELAIVIIMLAILAGLLMPSFGNRRNHTTGSRCVAKLQQIGLAIRIWEDDHAGRYPMAVPMTEGGALEFTAKGESWRVFQILSNELATTKLPVCPADPSRNPATNFASMTGSNVSYFVGVDAEEKRGKMFLAGDRNWEIDGNQVGSGLVAVGSNAAVSWTKNFHRQSGNILFADGSVVKVYDSQLRATVSQTGTNVNRLVFP